MAVEMNLRYAGELRTELTHGPSRTTIQTDAPSGPLGCGGSRVNASRLPSGDHCASTSQADDRVSVLRAVPSSRTT